MSNRYVTLGISNSDIKSVKAKLEDILEITFEERESSYKGKYFHCKLTDSQKIELGSNFEDGDWKEDKYKDYQLLLELSCLKNTAEVTSKILQNIDRSIFIKALEIQAGVSLKIYDFINGDFELVSEKSIKKKK